MAIEQYRGVHVESSPASYASVMLALPSIINPARACVRTVCQSDVWIFAGCWVGLGGCRCASNSWSNTHHN